MAAATKTVRHFDYGRVDAILNVAFNLNQHNIWIQL
jgi:hypothetical protein